MDALLEKCHKEADLECQLLNREEIRKIARRQEDAKTVWRDVRHCLDKKLDDAEREKKRLRLEKERIKTTEQRMKSNEEAARAAAEAATHQAMWNGYWANSKAAEVTEVMQWLQAERATSADLARRLVDEQKKVSDRDKTISENKQIISEYKQRYGPLPSVSLDAARRAC